MNHSVLRGTRRSILAGCSVLALLPLARSHAQAVPDTARLRAVIVTADRLPRPVDRTPSSVTVLSGETLRASGITQLADALRGVPGVNAVGSGSLGAQTSLFMRGGESDYVKVLVDGVVMNDPGGAIDLATINLANVERIEIVRGPASVQYGSDAVSGVIQIFTRQAQAPVDAQLTLRGGSYGTAIADGSLGLRGGRGWLTLGVAHHESEGMLAFNNEYRNDIVSLGTEWRAASRTTARWSLRHSDNEFHYPTDGSGRVVDRNARRGDRRLSSSVEVAHVFGPRVEGIVSFGSLNAHGRTDDASDGAADTLGFHAYRSHGVVRRRTGDARLILRPAPGQALLVGVEHATERQRGADSSNYDLSPNHFSAGRITRAAYAQWTGDAGRASWSLGSRYDDNDVYGIFRTARVAAAWRTWRGARVRGAVGGGFKAPTFLETFSGAFSVGNPALRPERSRGWEVGAEQRLPGRVTLGATYFDQRFRDLIQYTFRAPTDPNYFNVAAASARGLELEARTEPTAGVAVWGTATALRTRVDDAGFQSGAGATFVNGRRLLRRPPLTLSAGAAVSRIPRTRVDLALTHVGARDDRDFSTYPATPVELAGYSRMDVGLTYTLADGGGFWRASALTARLENALGAAYEEVANFAAPGRVVMLGLRVGTLR